MKAYEKLVVDNLITAYMNYTVVNNHYIHDHPKLKKRTHKNNELIVKYVERVRTEPNSISLKHVKRLLKRLIKFNNIIINDNMAPNYKEKYIEPRQSSYEYNEHFKEVTISAELLLMKSNL